MRLFFRSIILLTCWGCGSPDAPETAPPNAWANDRLWTVLEAQDRRDTEKLCVFLKDTSAVVREAAAMAFASVQDSASRPCLIQALKDPNARVRRNAAFALGWVADSTSLVLLNAAADEEPDTAIQRAMYEAGFRAELALRKHDALFLISYLESDDRDIRTRAAQQLARLPQEALIAEAPGVLHAISVEKDPAVRMFLVAALKHNATQEVTNVLRSLAMEDSLPMIRVAALRALGAKKDNTQSSFFLDRLNDADIGVQQTALEQLQRIEGPLDADAIWKTAQVHDDYAIKLPLCGSVMTHGSDHTRLECGSQLDSLSHQDLGPYLNAALIRARTVKGEGNPAAGICEPIVFSNAPSIMRLSAFESAWDFYGHRTTSQVELLRRVLTNSHDPGLIAAASERLVEMDSITLEIMLGDLSLPDVQRSLHPIRDLETILLLERVMAKREGRASATHISPSFNHPIDRARLAALKQGQQYRITTTKGEIILAIEPDAAPGSCVAFDSLVTAGYYNGKSFHRVIPNFVAQGGCPRGDGYGGMPWTLRTEIGLEGFVEGAVGLASAGHDTESCQFFIMLAPAPHLDGRYTRFAHVRSGMDVAQRLQVGDVMTRVERAE